MTHADRVLEALARIEQSSQQFCITGRRVHMVTAIYPEGVTVTGATIADAIIRAAEIIAFGPAALRSEWRRPECWRPLLSEDWHA